MTGMGFCDYCKTTVPTLELIDHITLTHQFTLSPARTLEAERWPDGALFVIPADWEPADFMEGRAREFFALLRLSWWQRVKARLRSLLVEDEKA